LIFFSFSGLSVGVLSFSVKLRSFIDSAMAFSISSYSFFAASLPAAERLAGYFFLSFSSGFLSVEPAADVPESFFFSSSIILMFIFNAAVVPYSRLVGFNPAPTTAPKSCT